MSRKNPVLIGVVAVIALFLVVTLSVVAYQNANNNRNSMYMAAQSTNLTPANSPTPTIDNSDNAVDQTASVQEQQVESQLNNLDANDTN